MARSDLTPFRLGELMERRWGGDPFMSVYRDMSRLMEDAFRGLPLGGMSGGLVATPRMDIHESADEICIETDLPGVSDKDVEVRLDEDVLTIRGERQSEHAGGGENYHVMERSMGALGTLTVKTPLSKLAFTSWGSTWKGRRIERWKAPIDRSMTW